MNSEIQPPVINQPSTVPPPVTVSPSNSPQPEVSVPVSSVPSSMVKEKKAFPKIIIILVILIILAGLIFGAWKFFGDKLPFKLPFGQKEVTLVYWGLFEPESVMQPIIADYETQHPGVKIQYSQQSLTQYKERLAERLSSTEDQEEVEVPDIFRIHQSWVPMFSGSLSEVPTSVYDKATFEKTFYPSALTSLSLQGQYVGIPLMYDGLVLYCNQDLFQAKGLAFPQDWSELKIAAQQLTTRDSQGKISTAGVALGNTTNVDHWSDILGLMFLQAGVNPANPGACSVGNDGSNICPGSDALQFYLNFSQVDRVWDATMPTSTFAFAKGNLAMYFGPSWRVFDIEGIKTRLQSNFQYKMIPVPQLPLENDKVAWATYWVEAVSKKSTNQEQAWEFLKYLSSPEVMQKMFQAESAVRLFGEPFSRTDMAELIKDHPYLGTLISQAPYAKNWYLSSFTSDNGLNDNIIQYFKNAIQGGDPVSGLQTAGQGVSQVLGQYGVVK